MDGSMLVSRFVRGEGVVGTGNGREVWGRPLWGEGRRMIARWITGRWNMSWNRKDANDVQPWYGAESSRK